MMRTPAAGSPAFRLANIFESFDIGDGCSGRRQRRGDEVGEVGRLGHQHAPVAGLRGRQALPAPLEVVEEEHAHLAWLDTVGHQRPVVGDADPDRPLELQVVRAQAEALPVRRDVVHQRVHRRDVVGDHRPHGDAGRLRQRARRDVEANAAHLDRVGLARRPRSSRTARPRPRSAGAAPTASSPARPAGDRRRSRWARRGSAPARRRSGRAGSAPTCARARRSARPRRARTRRRPRRRPSRRRPAPNRSPDRRWTAGAFRAVGTGAPVRKPRRYTSWSTHSPWSGVLTTSRRPRPAGSGLVTRRASDSSPSPSRPASQLKPNGRAAGQLIEAEEVPSRRERGRVHLLGARDPTVGGDRRDVEPSGQSRADAHVEAARLRLVRHRQRDHRRPSPGDQARRRVTVGQRGSAGGAAAAAAPRACRRGARRARRRAAGAPAPADGSPPRT